MVGDQGALTLIEVVFFDAGETILQPYPSWAGLSAKVLGDRGHDVDPEALQQAWREVGSHFRQAEADGIKFSLDRDASHRFWTRLYTEILGALGVDDPDAPELLYRTFSDPHSYELFDDALGCLRALRGAGYRLGVISNFESWLHDLLERLRIVDLFDVVAISGRLGWEKPDPRIFEWAVGEAGVTAASCLHVGDQPFFDADAAEAAGLRGVLLDRFGRYDDIEADYPRIRGLDELPGVVASIGARA